MKYIKVKQDFKVGKNSFISRFIINILPKGNKDIEEVNKIQYWFLEYDYENKKIKREIGFDFDNKVLYKAPNKDNYGLWVDSMYEYEFDKYEFITKELFELLWK